MKLHKKSHWLGPVGDILRAQTTDLRRLALIAGRDPKTFYADSDLSGADLRGQDLRGMRFSNDFNISNVVFDDETQFDPEIIQKIESEQEQRVLIWIDQGDPVFIQTSKEEFPFEFDLNYGGRLSEFEAEAAVHNGPAFVVLGKGQPLMVSPNYITIRVVPEKDFGLVDIVDLTADSRSAGLVIVPYGGNSRGGALTGPVRDLLELFSANWSPLSTFLESAGVAVFMRERGAGVNPREDAEGKLFQRALRLGLQGCDGLRNSIPHSPFAGTLFHELQPISVVRRRRSTPRFRAMTVFRSNGPRSNDDRFELALQRGLINVGWDVIAHKPNGSFHMMANNARFLIEIQINDQYRTQASIDVDQSISVHPWLSDRDTAWRLRAGRVVVSAADILAFEPDRPSIWSLIDIQSRRMAASRDLDAKSEYFKALIYSASITGSTITTDSISKVLNDPRIRIGAKMVEGSMVHSVYELSNVLARSDYYQPNYFAELIIDENGIRIS